MKYSTALVAALSAYALFSLFSMAAMSIGAAALIIVLVMIKTKQIRKDLQSELNSAVTRRYLQLSMILALTCILSLLVAKFWPLGFGGHFVEVRFFRDIAKLWYLFWPILLVIGLRKLSRQEQGIVLKSWLTGFALLSVIGLFQYFTGWPRPQVIPGSEPDVRYHVTLFLGHHLSVASILIFPFFAVMDLAFDGFAARDGLTRRSVPLFPKGILALIGLIGLVALFLTYSRMLWIALPVGLFVWLGWRLTGRARWVTIILCALILGGAVQLPSIQTRIRAGIGITERFELWKANTEFLKIRPLTGAGWRHNEELAGFYLSSKSSGARVFSGHAHNNFIDMLGGTGILGTLAWIAWCLGAVWLAFAGRHYRFQSFWRGLVCAWLVFHLNGLTQVNFWEAKVQHQLAWVLAWSLLWATSDRERVEETRA